MLDENGHMWLPLSDFPNYEINEYHGNLDPYIGLAKAAEKNRKTVRIVELEKTFKSVVDCADFLGVEPTNVSRCLTGSRKGQRLKGYHIEYAESEGLYESSNT